MYSFIPSRPTWAVGSELETLWGLAVALGIKVDSAELLESKFATRAWVGKYISSRRVIIAFTRLVTLCFTRRNRLQKAEF
jgi:predicted Kef-type K+ transport protein